MTRPTTSTRRDSLPMRRATLLALGGLIVASGVLADQGPTPAPPDDFAAFRALLRAEAFDVPLNDETGCNGGTVGDYVTGVVRMGGFGEDGARKRSLHLSCTDGTGRADAINGSVIEHPEDYWVCVLEGYSVDAAGESPARGALWFLLRKSDLVVMRRPLYCPSVP